MAGIFYVMIIQYKKMMRLTGLHTIKYLQLLMLSQPLHLLSILFSVDFVYFSKPLISFNFISASTGVKRLMSMFSSNSLMAANVVECSSKIESCI